MKIFGFEINKVQNIVPGTEQKGTTGRAKRFNDVPSDDISLYRTKQDVGKWRSALLQAENKSFPNRTEYYRMLKDIVIDAHLSSVIMQRKNAILCRDFKVMLNGEFNEEKTKALKTEWFSTILNAILDAEYYGFSLLDLGPYNDGFNDIVSVERQYVKPELGIVTFIPSQITGVEIEDPAYKKWSLYFCKDAYDLGLLMKTAPLVLWKKNAMGYWSEHTEKFGQPMRIGRTDTTDDTLRSNMEYQLKNMGSSFWAVLDKNDSFELLNGNSTNNYEIYDKLIERCNSELSKLVLGQTGTTDEKSFVGSAQVHKNTLSEIVEADDKWVTTQINKRVLPVLNMHGLGFENCTFEFNYAESLTLKEKAEVDAKFMPYVKYDKEYLEETYDIELEDSDDSMEGEEPKKPSLTDLKDIINKEYSKVCQICGGVHEVTNMIFFTEEEMNELVDGIWSGIYTVETIPLWLYQDTAQILFESYTKGFGYPTIEQAMISPDLEYLKAIRENVFTFSGAKSYHTVKDVSALMNKYPNDFNAFKKEAMPLLDEYNKNYLKTEYNTARSVGRSSAEWQRIQKNKEFLPTLTYQTVGDSLVRPSHAALDNITRPVDDKFWDIYYPPNGWTCRCIVVQGDEEILTDVTGMKVPDDIPPLFQINFAKENVVFAERHAYFKNIAKKDKDLALVNFNLPLPN